MAEGGVTPDVKDLDVSDADTDDLFASPSRTERKASKAREEELHTPRTSGTTSRSANGDSKYDRDGDREAALRRELAGVRSINEVIEGVVESLARAKGNMEVIVSFYITQIALCAELGYVDCLPYRLQRLQTAQHLDAHPFPDGTQSAPNSQSLMARCQPGRSEY